MPKENKTQSKYVLDALRTGRSMLLSDITRIISKAAGKEIKIQNTASLMAKLSNPRQFQTGHFITKSKTQDGYEYGLVPEIRALSSEELYGLTRKIGKDRFTLEMALKKVPELEKYLKKPSKTTRSGKSAGRKPATTIVSAGRKKSAPKKTKTAKEKAGGKVGRPRAVKAKPGRKPMPKPPEPELQKVDIDDLVAGFLKELDKMGGIRVHYYLTIQVQK
jgi:hypothetical protein